MKRRGGRVVGEKRALEFGYQQLRGGTSVIPLLWESCSARPMVQMKVRFSVTWHAEENRTVVVSGSLQELGQWDSTHGIALHCSQGTESVWVGEVLVPKLDFEYKYLLRNEHGESWEPMEGNRKLKFDVASDAIVEVEERVGDSTFRVVVMKMLHSTDPSLMTLHRGGSAASPGKGLMDAVSDETTKQLTALRAEVKKHQDETTVLRDRLSAEEGVRLMAEAEVGRLGHSQSEMAEEIKSVRSKLADSEQRNSQLGLELQTITASVHGVEDRGAEVEDLKKQLALEKERGEDLKKQQAAEKEHLEKQLALEKERGEDLKKQQAAEKEHLEKQLALEKEQAEDRKKQQTVEVEDLKKKLAEQGKEVGRMVKELQDKAARTHEETRKLQAKLAAESKAHNQAEEKIKQTTAQFEAHKQELQALKEHLDKEFRERTKIERTKRKIEAELAGLRPQLQDLQSKVAAGQAASKEVEKWQKAAEKAQREAEAATKSVEELGNEVAEARRQAKAARSEMERQFQAEQAAAKAIQDDQHKTNLELKQLRTQLAKYARHQEGEASVKARLQSEYNTMEKSMAQYRKQLDEEVARRMELEDRYNEMESELDHAKSHMENVLNSHKVEMREMRARVKADRTGELEGEVTTLQDALKKEKKARLRSEQRKNELQLVIENLRRTDQAAESERIDCSVM